MVKPTKQETLAQWWGKTMEVKRLELKEEFAPVSLKVSDYHRAEEVAEEMGVPVSHVIGWAATRMLTLCGQVHQQDGQVIDVTPGPYIKRIEKYAEDMPRKEPGKTTGIYISAAHLAAARSLSRKLGVTMTAFLGASVKELRDYRRKVAGKKPPV